MNLIVLFYLRKIFINKSINHNIIKQIKYSYKLVLTNNYSQNFTK